MKKILARATTIVLFLILIGEKNMGWSQVPEDRISTVFYVNNQHQEASDENPGTEEQPFRTIAKATALAIKNKAQNIGAKVIIYPGTYRESIQIWSANQETDAPIIFEAKEKGSVIISGSDIWHGWTPSKYAGIYSRPWPYKWGLAPYPPGWMGNVTLTPIVRRREMIFANERLLNQFLTLATLGRSGGGGFFVDEREGTLYIKLPLGENIDNVLLEVATRSGLFEIRGRKNVVLRGLRFQHDNTPVQGSAVRIYGSSNVLVEDCQFVFNNWTGLGFWESEHVTARRNVANSNGAVGMTTWRIKHLLFEDNETSYNNWRGAKGGFYAWAAAGLKNLFIRDGVYRRHRAVGNLATGFWLDSDISGVSVKDSCLCGNTTGLFIEASQGPIVVKDNVICHNQNGFGGVYGPNSRDVTLERNVVYGNDKAQMRSASSETRSVTNWESGEQMILKMEKWTLKNNIIIGNTTERLLVDIPQWSGFWSTFSSDKNLWYNPSQKAGFNIGGKRLDFSAWQKTTQQDANSVSRDLRLDNNRNAAFEARATTCPEIRKPAAPGKIEARSILAP